MNTVRTTPDQMVVVGRRRPVPVHVREIWTYRELLWGLTHKELKVRYKHSVVGFAWSMIQPVFLLAIYSIAFSVLGAGFERFPIWLLCGLIVWTFVSTSLVTSVQSVTANAYLVSKVRFPRAVLPLATVGSAGVHLLLQLIAFGIVLAVSRHPVDWAYMWLLVPATLTAVLLCGAMALLLSASNVKSRDTQHLLDLAMLGWFWLTPIIYQYARVTTFLDSKGIAAGLALVNPFTPIIIAFQRAIYGTPSLTVGSDSAATQLALLPDESQWWYLRNLSVVAVVSLVMIVIALNVFDRAEANFAEDL